MDTEAFLKGLDQVFATRQHGETAGYLKKHLAEAERQNDKAAMVTVLNEMAGYYRSVSKHHEAINAGQQAISLMQSLGYTDSAAYGTTLLNTATAYNASGDSTTALHLYEQVLPIYQKHLPADHMDLAALYNNLGSLYLGRGEDDKALQMLQKALPVISGHKKVYGESATIYTNLAQALFRLNKKTEALQVLHTAMRIFEGNPVRRDPHYAAALAASGQMYYAMQEYAQAVKAYESAVQYTRDCYGENKDFAIVCDNCALAFDALGQTKRAQEYREMGRRARTRLAGSAVQVDQTPLAADTSANARSFFMPTFEKLPKANQAPVGNSSKNKDDYLDSLLKDIDKLLGTSSTTQPDVFTHLTPSGNTNISASKGELDSLLQAQNVLNLRMQAHTKGLELSRAYYEAHGQAMIHRLFPEYAGRIAVGLVGEGSECFGFDDSISADHDFGPAFCMWLTSEDYQRIGSALQKAYEELPQSFQGFTVRKEEIPGSGRIGALCIDSFYQSRIGSPDANLSLMNWLRIPESRLAATTNGEVFCDPLGQFSRIREKLLAFYPEDVRLKKIATRAFLMGQSGQYNYGRCMSRGENVAAMLSLQEFIKNTCSMIFLLNKKYTPFYKWMYRGLKQLPILQSVADLLQQLVTTGLQPQHWQSTDAWTLAHSINSADQHVRIIEEICGQVRQQLYQDRLSDCQDDFLANHVTAITSHIADHAIRVLPLVEN